MPSVSLLFTGGILELSPTEARGFVERHGGQLIYRSRAAEAWLVVVGSVVCVVSFSQSGRAHAAPLAVWARSLEAMFEPRDILLALRGLGTAAEALLGGDHA